MIAIATFRDLARLLRCGDHQVDTVVREEPSARAALSRRGLFQAAGAVAAGSMLAAVPANAQLVFGPYVTLLDSRGDEVDWSGYERQPLEFNTSIRFPAMYVGTPQWVTNFRIVGHRDFEPVGRVLPLMHISPGVTPTLALMAPEENS